MKIKTIEPILLYACCFAMFVIISADKVSDNHSGPRFYIALLILDAGEIKGAGRKFQYAVTTAKARNVGCLLVNRIVRVYGANKDTLVECYFIQQVESRLGDLPKWQHANTFNEKQRAYLSAFIENSKKAPSST